MMRWNWIKCTKLFSFLLIVLLLLQLVPPIVQAQQQLSNETTMAESTSEQTKNTIERSNEPIVSSDTGEQQVKNITVPSTEKEAASTKDSQQKEKVSSQQRAGEQKNSKDISQFVTVHDWSIYQDVNQPLSQTTPAKSGENYTFDFTWSLSGLSGLQAGDEFKLKLPENEHWGFWSVVSSTPVNFTAKVKIDGVEKDVILGQWYWQGISATEYAIVVEFGAGVETTGLDITSITGVKFTIPDSLKNQTVIGEDKIQQVTFGGSAKTIKFEKLNEEPNKGYEFKYSPNQSNNNIIYDINVNLANAIELGGDYVNWDDNPTGFYLDGSYRNYWGEKISKLDSQMYVEDQLDPQVVVNSLDISALAYRPIQMDADIHNQQKGGITDGYAVYRSYVLKDNGLGPVYRQAGGAEDVQLPKSEYSFIKLEQENMSKTEFRHAIQTNPYQYGIYEEKINDQPVRTIMINFGNVSEKNDRIPSLSQMTDTQYAAGTRTITRKSSNTNVQVPEFAVKAADFCIRNNLNSEDQREWLEDYFTLVYGDSNVVDGQALTYNISMNLGYRPEDIQYDDKGDPIAKQNTAHLWYKYEAGGLRTDFEEGTTLPVKAEGTVKNPYGEIAINASTARLVKLDQDTYEPMNDVAFRLEKETSNNQWDAVGTYTTENYKELKGVIQTGVLEDGTYRFVEVTTPEGYDKTLSINYDKVLKEVVSEKFEISASSNGQMVYVYNKKKAQAQYREQHWVQSEGTGESQSDFSLRLEESKVGFVGETVEGIPKNFVGYQYKDIEGMTVKSGEVTTAADGTLVLKLYYVKDDEAIPFTINKLDAFNQPMPSVNDVGEPLAQGAAVFDVYLLVGWPDSGGSPANMSPPSAYDSEDKKYQNAYWQRLTTDENPVETDALGRIRLDVPLEENGNPRTFALVERTVTYPHYEQLSENKVWWVLWTGDGNNTPLGKFSGIQTVGDNYSDTGFGVDQSDKSQELYIKNRLTPLTEHFKVYKYDEDKKTALKSIPSGPNVNFVLYNYLGGSDLSGLKIKPGSTGSEVYWNKLGDYWGEDDASIKLFNVQASKEDSYYALVEQNNYHPGYQLPTGHWTFKSTANNEKGYHLADFNYHGADDPGLITPDDPDNPEPGHYVLLNQKKSVDFSFWKINPEEKRLALAQFELYQIDPENPDGDQDPTKPNTRWKLLDQAVSQDGGTNHGKVTFSSLKAGDYLLLEKKSPEGYELPGGWWTFTIDPTGATIQAQIKNLTGHGDYQPAFSINANDEVPHSVQNFRKMTIPRAGRAGLILPTVLGIVIVGLGILTAIYKPKKSKID
ncbi:SpaA isopeptide-forming pilin-related protein [Enterococcus pallens]|uniref:SpaA-like prealbumin fold domain-containing protein n=1 Tax=Enterococcus pallens ATCC BAA-351 TaxID=1158607 RepID=R2Q8U4_9ENTE|nr:SpaA isopeptide-forming pilin-related protein [Enterococcus pallens]EOH91698.1 hypothetical protein UAU_03000 [Enterococcus pallens ATCC BAA-351]EOU25126.1 hypothetical protein I588_01114 [Enterococcus pallens ATCC BAA-351]